MRLAQVVRLPPRLFVHLAAKKALSSVRRRIALKSGPIDTTAALDVCSRVVAVNQTIRHRLPIAAVSREEFRNRYVSGFGDEGVERVVERAERIRKGEFDLLGSGPRVFDGAPEWNRDVKTGYEWRSDVYHGDIRHMEPLNEPNDYKVPWELSRCHHLIALSQAFFLTRDERFAETVVRHVDDWIRRNPYEFGINWVCAMDVAIRAANWLWAYALLLDSESVDADFRALWLTSLVQHGRFIEANDEWGPLSNNHYLANGAGLLYLGLLLEPLRESRRFLRRGLRILTTQTLEQLSPDGGNREGSIPYHKLIVELSSVPLWLARRAGFSVSKDVWRRVESGYDFLNGVMDDEGNAPNVGDADDGRLHPLSEVEPLAVRPIVNVGSWLFERPEWGETEPSAQEEAFWLSGGEFVPPSRARRQPVSRGFVDSGYYVLRNGDMRVFVDTAPIGLCNTGGHGHNDALSFELDVGGEPFIVDSGTFVYKPDPAARNRFRSVRAHNTVEVDDCEPSVLCDTPRLWTVESPYRVRVHEWRVSDAETRLDAEHDGYARLPNPVTHRRRFSLNSDDDSFVIEDTLTGDGEHRWTWRVHVAPSARVDVDGDAATLRNACVVVRVKCPSAVAIEPSEVSASYGVREANRALVCRGSFVGSTRFEAKMTFAAREADAR